MFFVDTVCLFLYCVFLLYGLIFFQPIRCFVIFFFSYSVVCLLFLSLLCCLVAFDIMLHGIASKNTVTNYQLWFFRVLYCECQCVRLLCVFVCMSLCINFSDWKAVKVAFRRWWYNKRTHDIKWKQAKQLLTKHIQQQNKIGSTEK